MSAAPIDKFLPRVRVARELSSNKHAARYAFHCPGPLHEHGDRSASAVATVTHDGSLLLWCNAGCGAAEIIEAAGLELRDLFVEKPKESKGEGRARPRLSPKDALVLIKHEATVCASVMGRLLDGEEIPRADIERAAEAHRRLMRVIGGVYGI